MEERPGAQLLAEALRAIGFDFIGCTPGKPLTPVQDALVASGDAVWVNHEAVAAQYALGCGTGRRAACTC